MSTQMLIHVLGMPEDEPIKLHAALDPGRLGLEFDDCHYQAPLNAQGTAVKMASVLTFRGTLTSTVERVCSRCLEGVQCEAQEPFDLAWDILGKTVIDVTGELRDLMILARPQQFLCRAECRGLCAGCGVNLNHERCQCA